MHHMRSKLGTAYLSGIELLVSQFELLITQISVFFSVTGLEMLKIRYLRIERNEWILPLIRDSAT